MSLPIQQPIKVLLDNQLHIPIQHSIGQPIRRCTSQIVGVVIIEIPIVVPIHKFGQMDGLL
jgi:hypothetical protein